MTVETLQERNPLVFYKGTLLEGKTSGEIRSPFGAAPKCSRTGGQSPGKSNSWGQESHHGDTRKLHLQYYKPPT